MKFTTYKVLRVRNYQLVLEKRRLWFSKKAQFRLRLFKLRSKLNLLFK